MKNILLTLIILILNSCRFEKNNEVDVCATFDEIDAKIVASMDEIQIKHKGDRPFIDAFNMEHVYWVQYRDRRLRAISQKMGSAL